MKDQRLKGVAERLDLREVPCPSCRDGRTAEVEACANCGGSGRLWADAGSRTLSDSGLRRLA